MANRSNPTVYLAGAITGLTYEGAYNWREDTRKRLAEAGITAFSPMRLEEYTQKSQLGMAEKYGNIPVNVMGVVARDRNDCMTCDLVLMNLLPSSETGIPSLGSMIEIGWADAFRVPLVIVMEPDGSNPNEHGMVRGICPYITNTLEDGIELTKAILLPHTARKQFQRVEHNVIRDVASDSYVCANEGCELRFTTMELLSLGRQLGETGAIDVIKATPCPLVHVPPGALRSRTGG